MRLHIKAVNKEVLTQIVLHLHTDVLADLLSHSETKNRSNQSSPSPARWLP